MKTFAEKTWGDACKRAVAYSLNFVQMCYGYGSDGHETYFESVCSHKEDYSIQVKDFEYPKGGFSKKDYYVLDWLEYGVSEQLKTDLLKYGITEENFRPIYTRKHDVILGWQISPQTILSPTYQVNGQNKICCCSECEYYIYEHKDEIPVFEINDGFGPPYFITQEALDVLNEVSIALTDDKLSVYISQSLYEYLLQKYPRIECCPVLLGNIDEYLSNIKNDK